MNCIFHWESKNRASSQERKVNVFISIEQILTMNISVFSKYSVRLTMNLVRNVIVRSSPKR